MEANRRVAVARGTLAIDAMTVEVVSAMAAVGIRPILLKGPTLAALLYPEGGRSYRDCDLLVDERDIDTSDAVLTDLGFVNPMRGYARSEGNQNAITYFRGPNNVVDLHWNIGGARNARTTWEVLVHERDRVALGGRDVDILNVAGRAMHVALHAAHHGLDVTHRNAKAARVDEDLRRAVSAVSLDDWRHAAEIASAIGASNEFTYGLRLDPAGEELANRLNLPKPPPGWRSPVPGGAARGAATWRRFITARTPAEKGMVLLRAVVPSRARARYVADTKFGRSSLLGAYLEFWGDSIRGLGPALREVRRRRARR